MPGNNLDFFLSPCSPISGFFHLPPPPPHWQHVASIVFLAGFSHFNPSSCERKEEKKKDGSVSEEAQGSWGSLITVTTGRERERRRMKDTRDGAQQTWQESLSRDEMNQPIQLPSLCCWYQAVTSHPPQDRALKGYESVKQQRPGQTGGEVNASCSDRQTHMDCALNYCQSSSSQRLPRISQTTELWFMKIYRLQWESQLIKPNVDMWQWWKK